MLQPRHLICGCVVVAYLFAKVAAGVNDDVIEDILDNEYAYAEYVHPSNERFQTTTPPCCQEPTIHKANYIFLSTMDGKVTALDADNDGEVVWERDLENQPLLSGTLGQIERVAHENSWFQLIPSLDGSLYMYSDETRTLEPIPLTTDTLLQASVRLGYDALSGGKVVATTGLDPLTGSVRYHCSSAHCEKKENGIVSSTLVLRRTSNSLRAVDALNGSERWNLSVSEYEASLIVANRGTVTNTIGSRMRFLVQPPEGIVTAVDSCDGRTLWSRKLTSHIARVWRMEHAQLEEVSLFVPENIHKMAATGALVPIRESFFYLGTMNDEPFIINSKFAKRELQKISHNAIDWEPHSSTSRQLMPIGANVFRFQDGTIDRLLLRKSASWAQEVNEEEKDMQIVRRSAGELQTVRRQNKLPSSSCPNSDSFSVVKPEDIHAASFQHNFDGDNGWFVMKPQTGRPSLFSRIIKTAGQCSARDVGQMAYATPLWKVTLAGLASLLVTALMASGFFWKYKRVTFHSDTQTSSDGIIEDNNAETKSSAATISKVTLRTAEAISKPLDRISRSDSGYKSIAEKSATTFSSKFLQDFEPVKILGYGGFGVVFKAKNKLDQFHYAVKRVAVANNDKSINRVLREVRAMAQLDNSGIIRYYHTWIEKPPNGWQKETDTEMVRGMKAEKVFARMKEDLGGDTSELSSVLKHVPPPYSESLDNIDEPGSCVAASEEDSDSGSWMKDEDSEQTSSTSSDDEYSSSDDEKSLPPRQASVEDSVSIVFKSSSSKRSNVSKLGTEWALKSTDEFDVTTSKNISSCAYLYIQMQLCQEKTLDKWLRHNPQRPLEQMKTWMAQMCNAVSYIHLRGLIHRDIKPQNIFFSEDNMLKIGDLGLVTKCEPNESQQSEVAEGVLTPETHTARVGTKGYMSPEQLEGKPYTFKVDVFSMGLVYCELVHAFATGMERTLTLTGMQLGKAPEVLKDRPDEYDFVKWLTSMNADERPTCEEILDSDYLSEESHVILLKQNSGRRRNRSERVSGGVEVKSDRNS